jgi:hypothetical protein
MPCLGDDGRRMTGALAELMSPTALIMGDLAIACYASVSVQKNQATVVTERAKIVAPEIEIRGTVRGALGDPAAKPRQKKTRYNPCDNLRAKGDYERCKATSTERDHLHFQEGPMASERDPRPDWQGKPANSDDGHCCAAKHFPGKSTVR